jgi:hypothetical protein
LPSASSAAATAPTERTHEAVDDFTPVAAEELHYRFRGALEQAG